MHTATLFIWFILYSIIGWIYETIFCSIKKLKWDNRGMLNGPYCPIYGVGAVLDVLLCSKLPNARAVFFTCMAGSAVLEYVTSYTTERMFHAVWWDYSKLPFNLNGRICLPCSLGFGFAGWIVLYGLHPYVSRLTATLPLNLQELIALLFMAIFAADCTITADSLAQIQVKLEATMQAIDSQIAEKYETFIENTKQNLSEGLDTLKGKISLEEYREHRTSEEVKKTLLTMNWVQTRALRSLVSFRHVSYSDIGSRMKHALSFHKKLTPQEHKEIMLYLHGLLDTQEAELMKHYIQHGTVSTYDHVISVVRLSYYLNRRLHLGAPIRELVRGAFLHDFYLYDWHENGYIGRLHGLHHPAIALKNASMRYDLTPTECNIIESHMWPLTLFHIPKCRAAFIVCFADKICSLYEIVSHTKSLHC